jgi:hypothetical protein
VAVLFSCSVPGASPSNLNRVWPNFSCKYALRDGGPTSHSILAPLKEDRNTPAHEPPKLDA